MLRALFSNRLFIGGLAFFVLCVGGSLLYMQHVKRQSARALAKTQERIKTLTEKQNQQPIAEAPIVEPPEQDGHFHADGTWHAKAHAEPSTIIEDVPVSPHGFGPYPPLPKEWQDMVERRGEPFFWDTSNPNGELMLRVQAKLMHQGIPVVGSVFNPSTGLVTPTISGVVYVEWEWSGFPPRLYISSYLTTPEDGDRLDAIEPRLGRRLTARDVPTDIELRPLATAGINPYTFLDLP